MSSDGQSQHNFPRSISTDSTSHSSRPKSPCAYRKKPCAGTWSAKCYCITKKSKKRGVDGQLAELIASNPQPDVNAKIIKAIQKNEASALHAYENFLGRSITDPSQITEEEALAFEAAEASAAAAAHAKKMRLKKFFNNRD